MIQFHGLTSQQWEGEIIMDTRTFRTLLETNTLQTLGAVQTYAGQNNTSASMFNMILEEIVGNTSLTDYSSSKTSTILGESNTARGLRYDGTNGVFAPSTHNTFINASRPSSTESPTATSIGKGSYSDIISQAAEKYNLPDNLIAAVIKQESNFNNSAVSHAGAQGLMQLMPGTAKFLGVKDSFNPVQNVMGGANYLRQMLNQFDGNIELALAAYNAGPGNVKKHGGIPPFKETQQYVKKVLGYFSS
jgi:hypothetical protein